MGTSLEDDPVERLGHCAQLGLREALEHLRRPLRLDEGGCVALLLVLVATLELGAACLRLVIEHALVQLDVLAAGEVIARQCEVDPLRAGTALCGLRLRDVLLQQAEHGAIRAERVDAEFVGEAGPHLPLVEQLHVLGGTIRREVADVDEFLCLIRKAPLQRLLLDLEQNKENNISPSLIQIR